MILSDGCRFVIDRLSGAGYCAYAVGGCVRDYLMQAQAKDYDVATNALPDEILSIFSDCRSITNGIKHGTVTVIADGEQIEVTTFRKDGLYTDCRRPESVAFGVELADDLGRRDFTVNAMAYNEAEGIVDPFGGRRDISDKVIRCVGEPDKRFNEDALRIMRALRFASVCGFSVEEKTAESIHRNRELLKKIAAERIFPELTAALCGCGAVCVLDKFRDVFAVIIPAIRPCFDYYLSGDNHGQTLWEHMLRAIKAVEPREELRLAALLHDIAKPRLISDGNPESGGSAHAGESAELAEHILRALKAPRRIIDRVKILINYHDYPCDDGRSVKRLMRDIGGENALLVLSQIRRADIEAQNGLDKQKRLERLKKCENMCREFMSSKACVSIGSLDISGDDLISVGFARGKTIGAALSYLLDAVIDGGVENKKDMLLAYAKTRLPFFTAAP